MTQQETGKAEPRCAVEPTPALPIADARLSRAKSELPIGARIVDGLDAFHDQIGAHLDAVVSLHPCISDVRRRLAIEVLGGEPGPQTEKAASKTRTSDSENIGKLVDIETA